MSASSLIVIVLLQGLAISSIDAGSCTTCSLPTTVATVTVNSVTQSSTAANLTKSTDAVTGCKTITVTCPAGYGLLQITTNLGPQHFALATINNVFFCNVGGTGYETPLISTYPISDIVCYTIPCTNDLCSLSLIGLNLGNPNPCDMTQLTAVVAPSVNTGCMELYVTCPAGTSLYEILGNNTSGTAIGGSTDSFTCQVSPPAWISNAESTDQALAAYCVNSAISTNCTILSGSSSCSIPQPCYECSTLLASNSCAILNYPNTNIAQQINPQVTFNGQPFTSTIYANGLAECGNRPFTTEYPPTSNTSVNATLASGQFIGVFSCPSAMCVCTDSSNGTIDCYRGNSSVQILLVPVATPSPNSKAVILGIVLQSVISAGASSWSPPSNLNNLPALTTTNYIKINHLACVSGLSASCPNAA